MSTAGHVYQAINQVTSVMAGEGISKARRNQQQGYSFRGIDDVYAALSRVLADAKLCVLPRVRDHKQTERPTQKGGVQTFTVLLVDFDLVSAVDGSSHTITTVGEAQDSADKSSNKAMSAAMKYACIIAFQIPTEGDNDSDFSHEDKAPSPTLEKQLAASVEVTKVFRQLCERVDVAETAIALNAIANATAQAHKAGQITDRQFDTIKGSVTRKRGLVGGGAVNGSH